ncbi:MAG: DUF4040 domain-containing protein [Methylacidiphilales bacterium]|nr:DUF4040 domain-containing protein [Candidatus Methylacidiphilales bacterium]
MGLNLCFRVDGLSYLLLLIVSGIGMLIVLYGGGYLKNHHHEDRFYAFILLFMGSMLGVVCADNLYLLFIFWEMTSLSSYLLIGFNHERKEARQAALQALLITGLGGLALLAAIIIIEVRTGVVTITDLLNYPSSLTQDSYYPYLLALVLVAAFTKSAQFPFHFWLPSAMAAPTPVSAYLHSATMVKAGVFLLARLYPVLSGSLAWKYSLTIFGGFTMLLGAFSALKQTDLKKLLAYSTVSTLGTLILLLGVGNTLALKAAVLFLLVHALYKGALFMVAGTIDHETGTRNVHYLGGLGRKMPITATASFLAAFSMAGIPPFQGFISKEIIYEANLQSGAYALWLVIAGVLTFSCMIAVAFICGLRPFISRHLITPKIPHEAPYSLWLGPLILSVLGLIFGLWPQWIDDSLSSAVTHLSGIPHTVKLSLWHGLNLSLGLSLLTLLIGFTIYKMRHRLRSWHLPRSLFHYITPAHLYEVILHYMLRVAESLTAIIQHGLLRRYLMVFVSILLAGQLWANFTAQTFTLPWTGTHSIAWGEFILIALMLQAALAACVLQSRLMVVIALGFIGYGVALIYAFYGAPDLAITQVLVETLTLVLLLILLSKVSPFTQKSSTYQKMRDAITALTVGIIVAFTVNQALQLQTYPSISKWFSENSLLAKGHNVVNVIIVDFRALDTLGEITVLVLAAIGVVALLKKTTSTTS